MTVRDFTAHGFPSRVVESGPGGDEAVVFVHGGPGSADDWEALLPQVGRFARAVAFDLPGFGAAARPARWDYSADSLATFVAAALTELGVRRAHLVLSDLGGLAGVHWAAAHPDAFASVAAIDTGVLVDFRWHALARLHRLPLVGTAVARSGRLGLRQTMRLYEPGLPGAAVDRWADRFDWGTRRALLRFYRATPARASERLLSVLASLDRPALVLWGEHDRFVPVAQAERQRAAFPSADVQVLDGVGHYGHLEAPDRVADHLLPFLRARLAASPGGSEIG